MILPAEAHPLVQVFAVHFANPTYQRFSALLVGAVLTTGRRTVANVLRTLRHLAPGHRTDYQRVLSRAPWSGLSLGCALGRFVLDRFAPEGSVALVGDDTVDGHKGQSIYGKARHRDPVRSTHSYTAWRYGHRWVVLAVLVKLPFAARPWALPLLVDLYRSEQDDRARKRPHRTPARIMCGLLRLLLIRFPGRTFVFAGDSGYGTHEVARFCHRHRTRLTLVSKLHPDANLFDPPPRYTGTGRPRVKGDRRQKPRQAVAAAKTFTRHHVGWYGGGTRRVETLEGTGHWYKSGAGLVWLRWVFVRDATGTHRDEYFFTTDPDLSPARVIGYYCGRWNIETYHKVLKSGCQAERLKLRTADRLTNLLAVFCIIGWRVFWLTMINRVSPDAPAESVLTGSEIAILDRMATSTAARSEARAPKQTVSDYLVALAKLGGYLARTNDPPPRNMVLWRGLTRLTDIHLGYELRNRLVGN
jgi:hypothetical protein